MHINTTQMQRYQIPPDEPNGAFGINPAEGETFKLFDVHQINHKDKYFTLTTEESTNRPPPKKQRRFTAEQRKMCSAREKERMGALKQAFQELKKIIPGGSEQQLSKVKILRQATAYIKELDQQLGFIPDLSNSIEPINQQE